MIGAGGCTANSYFFLNREAPKRFREFQKKNVYSRKSCFLVAEDEGRIVGVAIGKLDRRAPVHEVKDIGFILSMYVAEDYRRQGVGKLLMDGLSKWFRKKGISYMELHAHSDNPAALGAYEKYGFKTYLHVMRKKI